MERDRKLQGKGRGKLRGVSGLSLVSLVGFCGMVGVGCKAIAPADETAVVKNLARSSWSASSYAQSGVDHDWVARFADKRLDRWVAKGLESAPDLRVAAERLAQVEQNLVLAGAALKPSAIFEAGVRRNKLNFIGGFFGGSTVNNNNMTNVAVSWEPDVFGRKRAGQSAMLGQYQAQVQELRAAKTLLAARICKSWFLLAEANQQIVLAEQALKIRKEIAAAVERRFEQNLAEEGGSAAQLRLAQSDIAQAKAVLSQRKGEAESYARQLQILVGHYPSAKLKGPSKIPRLKNRVPIGLPSELLQRRPDIIAAERRYAASKKKVKEAELAVYPSFSLTASAGTSTESLRNILNSNFGVWSLGGGLVQPLLTGGRIKTEKKQRDSGVRQSLAELQSTVITAFGEVETALANEKWLIKRINDFNEAHRLASEAAEAAEQDYANGTGDVLVLLNAQNRRISLASQVAILRRLRAEMRVDLHLALGGGFMKKGTQ